jgi:16S rRNA (uracil1498-N3)-methyltransferase
MGAVLRVPVHHLEAGEMTLDEGASKYVARVRRLRVGDALLLFHPREAREAEATIVEIGRSTVRCRVHEVRAAAVRALRPVTLVQASGKGDKLDAVVRDATELGATRVVVAESARSVVRLDDKGEARMRRLRRIADEAARQCGRGDAPEIVGPLPWSEAIRAETGERALKLCFWERATAPAGHELLGLGPDRPLVVAAGPEGGLDEAEIDTARAAGFAVVSLGPFILRTETVAAAVLGAALVLGSGKSGP